MSRRLFYDVTFILSALAGAAAVMASGCSAEQIRDSGLLTPGPDGQTPLDKGIGAIPRVVGNPLDLEAWQAITGALVLGAGAAFGYKKAKDRKKKAKCV
jgi:hypothetical protein